MYHIAVVRKFEAFDQATINEEFLALTRADFRDLTHAMAQYQRGEESGYIVKNYGDGLMMIKGNRQGRCLWFSTDRIEDGIQVLTALLVYKKETMRVPDRILQTARERMGRR